MGNVVPTFHSTAATVEWISNLYCRGNDRKQGYIIRPHHMIDHRNGGRPIDGDHTTWSDDSHPIYRSGKSPPKKLITMFENMVPSFEYILLVK